MNAQSIRYKRHRFPPAIITHAVWLYCRFNLSLREVEEIFLDRGIDVSYETIRRWVAKSGPSLARGLCCRQPRPGDIWHLDEVVVKIKGRKFWLWCAVDHNGIVLDKILQCRRDKKAAKRLLHRLMKRLERSPKRFITDKLRSYGAAKRETAPSVEHRSHKGLNNRVENSHLPFQNGYQDSSFVTLVNVTTPQSHIDPGRGPDRAVLVSSACENTCSGPTKSRRTISG